MTPALRQAACWGLRTRSHPIPRTRPQGWSHQQPSSPQDAVQSHSVAQGAGEAFRGWSRLVVCTLGWHRKARGALFCFFLYRFPGSSPPPGMSKLVGLEWGRESAFAWFSGALQCHRKGWPGQELLIWGARWFANEGTGGPR